MYPKNADRGSVAGVLLAVLAVVVLLAAVFVGWRLNQDRSRLMVRVDALQSEVAAANARLEELQKEVNAERAARTEAERTAKEAGDAAVQARQELQRHQEELGSKVQELQAGLQDYEQRLAATEEAKTKAETELARALELRKTAEQELATLRSELQQQAQPGAALAGGQEPQGQGLASTAGAGEGEGEASMDAGTASPMSRSGQAASRSAETTAAKQQFGDAGSTDEAGAGRAFDTPPQPRDLARPEYPFALRQRGVEGSVTVAFTVDVRGRVQDIEVQESTHEEFERAAVAAVRTWRFEPAQRDGKPVAVRISQRLAFTSD